MAYIFQNHHPSFNEKSTTQATFESFKSNSFASSMNFEKNQNIDANSQLKFLLNSSEDSNGKNLAIKEQKAFRKISFEEESELKHFDIVKKFQEGIKKEAAISKETEEILKEIREKNMDLEAFDSVKKLENMERD